MSKWVGELCITHVLVVIRRGEGEREREQPYQIFVIFLVLFLGWFIFISVLLVRPSLGVGHRRGQGLLVTGGGWFSFFTPFLSYNQTPNKEG